MSEINWSVEILALSVLLQERERVSQGRLPLQLPTPRADAAAIAAAEMALGVSFDPEHRAFLQHANGWDLSSSADLFGTSDFVGSVRFRVALESLQRIPRRVLGPLAAVRDRMVPVSSKEGITDLFVMVRGDATMRPEVHWVAVDEVVGSFESFSDVFLNFKSLTEESIERFVAKARNPK